jgi:galactokinase/mevalonate kinase-like predicted kinase
MALVRKKVAPAARVRPAREECLSAAELAHALARSSDPESVIAACLAEARHWSFCNESDSVEDTFRFARMVHSLGSALAESGERGAGSGAPEDGGRGSGLERGMGESMADWAARLKALAFEHLQSRIVASGPQLTEPPVNRLRSDELVWYQAPVRLDFAGGWTDTPPFALEQGGQVLNAAVQLKGQRPIQVFARVIPEKLIRCRSIDRASVVELGEAWSGEREEGVRRGEKPSPPAPLPGHHVPMVGEGSKTKDEFALAKAALSLAGFGPTADAPWAADSLAETLERFGGGLELTSLAAIPQGSGLGTSSIMGAVYLAAIFRVLGRELSGNELFNAVLRLEQVMTTGGGWQDQVGGVVAGLKRITSPAGMIPATTIVPLGGDLADPRGNGGQTLLYYTGITRMAKNILQQVVGRWLDREREAVATLGRIRQLAGEMEQAIAAVDLAEFGRMVGVAWELNKRLDPNSTTPEIDRLLERIERHLHGAKLLGAGGGGFLFLVCKSPGDAEQVRRKLEDEPPNPRARFFDYEISDRGLTGTVC